MWTYRTPVAVVVALIGSLGLAPAALAQANCDWYAKTALEQQKANVDRKCGFSGPAWSLDRTAHMNWCASAPPDQWKKQAQERQQALAKCVAGK